MLSGLLFLLLYNPSNGFIKADSAGRNTSTETGRSTQAVSNDLLNVDGFENQHPASFWHAELWTPFAGQLTSGHHRAGQQSMCFTWQRNQVDGTNKMLHAELATSPLDEGENERWYGYSSFMPSASMANDSQTVIVTQWHGFPDEGGAHTVPAIAISVEPGNTLQLVYRASSKPITSFLQKPTSQKIIKLGAASFDRWVDYVVHVKWSPTDASGLLQVWQNGVLVVDEQRISIGYQERHKPYWKIGLYCWTGKSNYESKAIYYDEVRIGGASGNYDIVNPNR